MVSDRLTEYRAKRDFTRTPEPAGKPVSRKQRGLRFTIQEHHATALHWDFRLEHEGVLVSWAVPRGLPRDPKRNHLAVHTEDHPMSYLTFKGVIPEGYGAGKVILWDTGTYEAEKFREDEVIVRLHGRRIEGKYALFQTDGDQWMVHRMDPHPDPAWLPLPRHVRPMEPRPSRKVPTGDEWAFEVTLGGLRTVALTEEGRMKLMAGANDVTSRFPEVRLLGEELGLTQAVLDGEIAVLSSDGAADGAALQRRLDARPGAVRRLASTAPATYLIRDLLQLEGRDTRPLAARDRRELLSDVLPEGSNWQLVAQHQGDGEALLAAAKSSAVIGLLARRVDSAYVEGSSPDWLLVRTGRAR